MSKERLFEVMSRLDKTFKPKLNESEFKNDDPTKEEMQEFLKSKYHSEDDFDVESAIYWFANDYHGGQSSNLYSALSTSEFRPGPMHRGIEDEESEMATMMYKDLEDKYAGGSQEAEPELDNSEWMGLSMNEEEKWMQDAVKRPGALHKKLGIPEDQEIPMELINKKLAELKKKSEGDKTLSKDELQFQRQLNFAKNAKNINENFDYSNTSKEFQSWNRIYSPIYRYVGDALSYPERIKELGFSDEFINALKLIDDEIGNIFYARSENGMSWGINR